MSDGVVGRLFVRAVIAVVVAYFVYDLCHGYAELREYERWRAECVKYVRANALVHLGDVWCEP